MTPHMPLLRSLRFPLACLVLVGQSSAQAFLEQAKLAASDATFEDNFGVSVALSGDTALIGADRDSHSSFFRPGSAYVLVRNGTGWTEQAKLTASDPRSYDSMGQSVALEGDTAVVGVPRDDVWVAGNLREDAGSVHVFVRSGTAWTLQATLVASPTLSVEYFGGSVAIAGDTVVVGARGRDAAYVFTRSGTTWTQQARLLADDGTPGDFFGASVAISGDRVVIGASNDDHAGSGAGSVYVFSRNGGVWDQEVKLLSSDLSPGDQFGNSVSISGGTLIAGAELSDGLGGAAMGSAYVFEHDGVTWSERAKLVASDFDASDRFGSSVALVGDTVVVGAAYHDDGGHDSGAVYVFVRQGSSWTETSMLTAGGGSRTLGASVALSADTILAGAPSDDTCAGSEGAAYVFGPGAVPPRPHIDAIAPESIPNLVPGTAQTVVLTGSGFDLITQLLLQCVPVDPARYTVVSPTRITLDMPQAPALGANFVGVTDGLYTDVARVWVYSPAGPVYELGNGEPLNVVDRDDGLPLLLAGPVGSRHFLYASLSSVPSTNRFVSLAIGNQFTELIRCGGYVIPAAGWLEVRVPSANLPDPGPGGLVLYSQSMMLRGRAPFQVSSLQSIQLVQ